MSIAGTDDDVIRVRFSIQFAEHLHVHRLANWKSILRFGGPMLLFIALGSTVLAMVPNSGFFEVVEQIWPYLLLSVPLVLLLMALERWRMRRRWRQSPVLGAPKSYEFMKEGFRAFVSLGEERVRWGNVKWVRRSGSMLLLGISQGLCFWVPIRAFRDRDQWERFRQLVETAVPGARLPSGAGLKFAADLPPVPDEPPADLPTPSSIVAAGALADEGADESIRIHVTPTLAAYLRFNLRAFVIWPIRAFLIMALLWLLTSQFLEERGMTTSDSIFLLVFGAASTCVINAALFGTYLRLALRWAWSNELREPRTYSFSAARIEIAATTFANSVDWKFITRAVWRGGLVVLLSANKSCYAFFPRRAFSDEDWARFRQLVKSKVADNRLG